MYCDAKNLNLTTQFLDLVPVCDNTANGLYGALKASFQAKNIPMNNIVGFSSGTTNVMFGSNESVVALLNKGYPDVVTIKCSCHMIHLCASYACLKLSTSLEDLVRNVYAHFSRYSKRFKNFEEFQTFCGTPVHKFLCLSRTRWLSVESVVNRVLEQWSPLHLCFTDDVESKCDPSNAAKSILQSLHNVFQKAVLEFLSF